MKKLDKSIAIRFIMVVAVSMALVACFKEFDPDSYKPPFTISGFTAVDEIQPSSLVAYWSFDGIYVESKSNEEGTNVGTTFTNGFKAQALQGALNSYVTTNPPSGLTSMSSFTISFWVNTPPPSSGIIGLVSLAKPDGFWGNIEMFFENGSDNSNGKFRTVLFNGTSDRTFGTDGIKFLFDKWTHITATYDGATSTYKLYVNGSKASTIVADGYGELKVTNPGKLVFGTVQFMTTPSSGCCGPQPWASYLTGQLDEVRIYNKVLTDSEINALVVLQGKGK
jgi:Concanavalin A-like lectin/glucanases superfamily